MRNTLFTTLLGLALVTGVATGCKKENKATTGSAAAGSAAVPPATDTAPSTATNTATDTAAPAAGSAAEAAAVVTSQEVAAAALAKGTAADPGPRPASVTDADIAMADKMISAMGKLSAGVGAAGADCKKAAEAIKALGGDFSAMMVEGKKMDEKMKGDAAAKEWFERTYAPKAMSTMGKMLGSPCVNDEGVKAAMATLNI